jgi:hypothetical protein
MHWGEEKVQLSSLFNLGARQGVGGQRHDPAALPPEKRPGTHCTGSWVALGVGLDGFENSRLQRGFEHGTTQHVASRYTDSATPGDRNITACDEKKDK